MSEDFIRSLKQEDLGKIRANPKSDLHNHSLLGGRRAFYEKAYGKPVTPFRAEHGEIREINTWINEVYVPLFLQVGIEKAIEAAFVEAYDDGVTVLEMSVDCTIPSMLQIRPAQLTELYKKWHRTVAPAIDFRLEVGMPRSMPVRSLMGFIEPYLGLEYVRGIDLYDDELSQPAKNFKGIYQLARKAGWKCKAHAGEFGSAESVRETVEMLELDEVQHGIAAASSPEVMRWLAKNGIRLNICPTSNVVLKRAPSYAAHPVRILADNGVRVTIGTDDVLLFDKGVSEEFLLLYMNKVFSAEELDMIRQEGLSTPGGAIQSASHT